ncbi:hypothetical protein B0H19DRAFT_1270999 [Mycena capillaripes]|nr:hypothetical protein B0H19DRAFT_1270999 [Mycena capillaripes]
MRDRVLFASSSHRGIHISTLANSGTLELLESLCLYLGLPHLASPPSRSTCFILWEFSSETSKSCEQAEGCTLRELIRLTKLHLILAPLACPAASEAIGAQTHAPGVVNATSSPLTEIPPWLNPKCRARRANTAECRATHNAVERETLNGRFGVCLLSLSLALPLPPSFIATVHTAYHHRLVTAKVVLDLQLSSSAACVGEGISWISITIHLASCCSSTCLTCGASRTIATYSTELPLALSSDIATMLYVRYFMW